MVTGRRSCRAQGTGTIFDQPRSLRRSAYVSVVSALAFFVLFQLLFNLVVQKRRIELRDPEYGYKLATLKHAIRQDPDRPLLLILGSSRTEVGVIPSELHLASSGSAKSPFIFNMSLVGSGPVLELFCLKRLLAEGIRPRWVMIEVLPVTLSQEPVWSDTAFLSPRRLGLDELPLLCKYNDFPDQLRLSWFKDHVVPLYTHRDLLLKHYTPLWLPPSARTDNWLIMDGNGFRCVMPTMLDGPSRQRSLAHAETQYAAALQRFALNDKSDQAMHELLGLCQQQHISTLLYLMPEGERFRSWYSPAVQETIRYYLERLAEEYGSPLVDARTWFHEEDFADSHHLLQPGALALSRKLGSEVNKTGFLHKIPQIQN